MAKLPPTPVGVPPGHSFWNDWYEKLRNLINNTQLNHNDLQSIQGGNTTERYHLTSAQQSFLANNTSTTYTPTLTNVANVSSSTAFECGYMRINNWVFVQGRLDVTPTAAAGTATQVGISLPIASSFAASGSQECTGTAYATAVVNAGAAILADNTNDRARMQFAASSTAEHNMIFFFAYRIV